MLNQKSSCKVLGLMTAAMLGVASFTAVAADTTSSDMRTPTAGTQNSSEGSNIPSDVSSSSGSMPATNGTDSAPVNNQGLESSQNSSSSNSSSSSNADASSSNRSSYHGSNTATDERGWLAERQISQSDGAPAGNVLLPSFYDVR